MTTERLIFTALDRFRIELPSWGFADTGTRFGVFYQPAAARTLEERLADAAFVHSVTGVCPTVALHVQWDLPGGLADVDRVRQLARHAGIVPGAINPNFFQDQAYKHGSFGHVDDVQLEHIVEVAQRDRDRFGRREDLGDVQHVGRGELDVEIQSADLRVGGDDPRRLGAVDSMLP